ncbi:Fluconazole resistance protein 1, partial [Elasticomyces elasticus]
SEHALTTCSYVEILEQQQSYLVAGLHETYRRLRLAQGWPGAPLQEIDGHPLTHDILERLELLVTKGDRGHDFEGTEECCQLMQQQQQLKNRATYTERRGPVNSESEYGHRQKQNSNQSSTDGTPGPQPCHLGDLSEHSGAPASPPTQSILPWQSEIQTSFQPASQVVRRQCFEFAPVQSGLDSTQLLLSRFKMQIPEFDKNADVFSLYTQPSEDDAPTISFDLYQAQAQAQARAQVR